MSLLPRERESAGATMDRRQTLTTVLSLGLLSSVFSYCVLERRGWEQIARTTSVGDLSYLYRVGDDEAPSSSMLASSSQDAKSAKSTRAAEVASSTQAEQLAWQPLVETSALSNPSESTELVASEGEIAHVEAGLPELVAVEVAAEVSLEAAIELPVLRSEGQQTLELAEVELDDRWPAVEALTSQAAAPAVASQYVRRSPMEIARLDQIENPTFTEPVAESERVIESEPAAEPAVVVQTPVVAEPSVPIVAMGLVWAEPSKLMGDLERLTKLPDCESWAHRTAGLVRRLASESIVPAPESREILAELRVEYERGQGMSKGLDRKSAIPLRLVLHALERRLDLWEASQGVIEARAEAEMTQSDVARLCTALSRVEPMLAASSEGEGWRQYLLLGSLSHSCRGNVALGSQSHRDLARLVLERIDSPELSDSQRAFLSREPMLSLAVGLRELTHDPMHLGEVLAAVEAYEQAADPENARRLAESSRRLASAHNPAVRQLSEHLESHYRNHNVRVAISADLMNRMIPQPDPMAGAVRDTILGIPVRGRQTTVSKVGVKLIPNDQAIAIDLQVKGQVDAITTAKSGPATLYSDNDSVYTAVKPIRIDASGVTPEEAQVEVDTVTNLRGLKTDLDGIPLVGALLRSYVHSKHASSKEAALAETDWKVGMKVTEHLDELVSKNLMLAAAKYQERVVHQVSMLNLEPLNLDMQTTADRISLRGRLAGEEQLGSHTPRPQALSDSLASVQLHESAINNLLDKVGLAGNEFTPGELQELFVKKFQLPTDALPRVIGRDVKFHFAESEPVRIRCYDGKLEITLKLDRVENGRQESESVLVRAVYRPKVESHSVELVRDGNIDIEGEGLRGRSNLAMRAVFSKIFPKERPWLLVPPKMFEDPRLADIGVTQFVLRDGWMGASIGPRRKEASTLETVARDTVREVR